MAKEPDARSQTGSFKASDSSGSHEVRRKRVSGTFDASSAARTLDMLGEKSLHGSIVVSDGFSDVSFFFTRGGLRVMSLGKSLPSLAARLVAQGKLDPALAPRADAAMKAPSKKEGSTERREERDILIEVLSLSPTVVDEVSREVLAEVFLDCLFWEDPQFEAITGEPDPEVLQRRDLPALTLSLGIKDLVEQVKGRLRQVTDLRKTMATMQVVVEPLQKGRDAAASSKGVGDPARTKVVKKVVSEPGLRAQELGRRLTMGEHELALHLHELVTQGHVKLDRQPLGKEEELARLRAMEEKLDEALSQLVRRLRVAQEAVAAGDDTRAGGHLARAGGILLKDGRDDEAVKTLQQAVELAPENLEGREGFVQGLWQTNRVAEAVNESEELGRRYLELNLPGRAKRILEKALGREERTGSLDLLVKAYVKLRQPKAAAEAGERLLNRLRREGRAEEARQIAADLFELATDSDKTKLLRAAGADRRAVVALMAVALVLAAAFVPASQALSARTAYQEAAHEAENTLRGERDLARMKATLAGVRAKFETLGASGGEIGESAQGVLAHLQVLDGDLSKLERLKDLFPWQQTGDLEAALKQFEAVRPESVALAKTMRALVAEVKAFKAHADEERDLLLRLEPSEDSIARAVRVREEYKGLPEVLGRMVVRVRIVSQPPGARVTWDGIDYSQPTPQTVVGVPLLGQKQLVVAKEGFAPFTRTLGFEALKGPEFLCKLESVRGPDPVRQPTPTPPPPDPRPATPDPQRGSGGIVSSDPQPQQEAARPQVEFRDGGWQGDGDARFKFEQDARYLATIELEQRFRATLQVVNRSENTNVRLTGIRVYLEVLGSVGWRREPRPLEVEFDDEYVRPVISEGGGKYRVQAVQRTLHMEEAWFKTQCQDAVKEAVRQAKIRERDSRMGR